MPSASTLSPVPEVCPSQDLRNHVWHLRRTYASFAQYRLLCSVLYAGADFRSFLRWEAEEKEYFDKQILRWGSKVCYDCIEAYIDEFD